MYVSRRHFCRLLLPPGWVALGFLLLLGCQVLLAHRRQILPHYVMQLTMFPLKLDTAMARLMVKDYDMPYRSLGELDTARNWHTIDYRGMLLTDADNRLHIKAAVQLINTDTAHEGGVRIRLHEHATYATLVEALDVITTCNQRKYFLDIRHKPITLYAITNKYVPVKVNEFPLLGCLLYNDVLIPIMPIPTWKQLLIGRVTNLWQQAWRPTTLIFVVITALSCYRLARPPRSAH